MWIKNVDNQNGQTGENRKEGLSGLFWKNFLCILYSVFVWIRRWRPPFVVWLGTLTRVAGYTKKNRVRPSALGKQWHVVLLRALCAAMRALEWERVFRVYPATPLFVVPSIYHESATFYWNIFRKVLQWTIKIKSGTMSLRQTFPIDTKEYESDVWQE